MRIALLIMAVLFFSCQKDEKEAQTEKIGFNEQIVIWDGTDRKPEVISDDNGRVGEYFEMFYKESVTLDNYLTNDTIPRQIAYNKKQIDTISLTRIAKSNSIKIQINGVYVTHYRYKLTFKLLSGQEYVHGTVWSVAQGNTVKYAPFGLNVVDGNVFKTEVERTKELLTIGSWIYGLNQTKTKHKVKVDGIYIEPEYLFNPSGGYWLMPHK